MNDAKLPPNAPNPLRSASQHAEFPEHAYCKQCDYQLYRVEGEACPECGSHVDPSDPLTYWDAREWPEAKKWAWGLALMFGFPILFFIIWMWYEYV